MDIKNVVSIFNKRGLVILHDLVVVVLAWFGAFWFRFNFDPIPESFLQVAYHWSGLVVLIQVMAFTVFGMHRGEWRFASMPDLLRISKSVILGTLLILTVLFLTTRLQQVPRSIFPLYAGLLAMGLGFPRFLYRWMRDRHLYITTGSRALIVGAGRAGEMLVRDLLRDPGRSVFPVGFVDDKTSMRGREIHGVRIIGNTQDIPKIVVDRDIDVILLALPSATASQMQRIVEICEKIQVPFRTLPRMEDLMAGHVTVETLRNVSIEDLLGREPVRLDRELVHESISDKTILISGGGGSIGSELCRQVVKLGPSTIIVIDQSEYNLYMIDRELREQYPDISLVSVLVDVIDSAAVNRVFDLYKPEVVLHAAAYKHVPMLENQAREAAHNNIIGTRTVACAADRVGTGIFVLVSTDKAVNPTNIMGATKRAAEIFCQNFNARSDTKFITVRFGNVLGSAGSVVPLFQEQIRKGGPVTVTHPKMTRYFMTIPEASQLILQAGVMGEGGEIFVLDMGEPVSITYLAEQMIRLSGLEPGEDIEITYTGLRPGEKLYEELFHEKESLVATRHEKILLARHRAVGWSELQQSFDTLSQACDSFDDAAVREQIKFLVPELHAPTDTGIDNIIPFDQRHKA